MKGAGAVMRVEEEQMRLVSAFLDYRVMLARFLRRLVGAHDIEDIVQETFIRAYEAAGKQKILHPRSFMRTTALNLALNSLARADTRLADRIADFSASDVLVTETLESQFESGERFRLFCQAVSKLPTQCRRAFILKKVYGLSQKEVSDYLGISESTVEKHIAKGLLVCIEYMESTNGVIGKTATPARSSEARSKAS